MDWYEVTRLLVCFLEILEKCIINYGLILNGKSAKEHNIFSFLTIGEIHKCFILIFDIFIGYDRTGLLDVTNQKVSFFFTSRLPDI